MEVSHDERMILVPEKRLVELIRREAELLLLEEAINGNTTTDEMVVLLKAIYYARQIEAQREAGCMIC